MPMGVDPHFRPKTNGSMGVAFKFYASVTCPSSMLRAKRNQMVSCQSIRRTLPDRRERLAVYEVQHRCFQRWGIAGDVVAASNKTLIYKMIYCVLNIFISTSLLHEDGTVTT